MEEFDEFPIEYVGLLRDVADAARAERLACGKVGYASHKRLVLATDRALDALEKYNEG